MGYKDIWNFEKKFPKIKIRLRPPKFSNVISWIPLFFPQIEIQNPESRIIGSTHISHMLWKSRILVVAKPIFAICDLRFTFFNKTRLKNIPLHNIHHSQNEFLNSPINLPNYRIFCILTFWTDFSSQNIKRKMFLMVF